MGSSRILPPRGCRGNTPRAVLALAGMLAVGSCGVGTDPEDLSEVLVRQTFTPSSTYLSWWAQIRECSGMTGSYGDLRFFVVVSPVPIRGTRFPCGDGLLCNGLWEAPHDITVAPAFTAEERLIKHEMLHDLIGHVGHPPVFGECGVTWDGDGGDAGEGRHSRP